MSMQTQTKTKRHSEQLDDIPTEEEVDGAAPDLEDLDVGEPPGGRSGDGAAVRRRHLLEQVDEIKQLDTPDDGHSVPNAVTTATRERAMEHKQAVTRLLNQCVEIVQRDPVECTVTTAEIDRVRKFLKRAPDGGWSSAYANQLVLTNENAGKLTLTALGMGDSSSGGTGILRFSADVQASEAMIPPSESIVIQRDIFLKLVRSLEDGEMMRIRRGALHVTVEADLSMYSFPLFGGDMPEAGEATGGEPVGFVDKAALYHDLNFIGRQVSTDSMRPGMQFAKVDEWNGDTVLVATDGHTLASAPLQGDLPDGLMIPMDAFDVFRGMHANALTLYRSTTGKKTMADDEADPTDETIRYTLVGGDERFSWTAADESFPDWKSLCRQARQDADEGTLLIYDVGDFVDALGRLSLVTGGMNDTVLLRLSPGHQPRAEAEDVEQSHNGQEELPMTTYNGTGALAAFNVTLALRLFKELDSPVRLRHAEPSDDGTLDRAMYVTDRRGRMALLMPVLYDA